MGGESFQATAVHDISHITKKVHGAHRAAQVQRQAASDHAAK